MFSWQRPTAQDEERIHLRRLLDEANARIADLMRTIIDMQREGFRHPSPALVATEPEGPDLAPDVLGAIASRADPGTPEWAHLEAQALQLMERESDPTKVAQEILKGADPTDYVD